MRIAPLLLCLLGVAYVAAKCGEYVATDGTKYNLDPLTRTPDYQGKEDGQDYVYWWNFCQDLAQTGCFPAPAVSQVSQTGTCISLGYSPPKFGDHPDGPKKGVKITYTNSKDSFCGGNVNRVSVIVVSCSAKDTELVKITEPGVCEYQFAMNSKFACPPGGIPGIGPGGLSPGSIFLIIFFVGFALYFAIGSVVMWKVKGATGIEILPNSGFWVGLPGLIKDGFGFVKGKVTGQGYTPV